MIKDEDVKVELGADSDCEEKEESRDELDCDPGDYDDDYEHFSGEDEVKPAKPALDLLVKSEKRQRKTPKVKIYANVSAKTIQKSPICWFAVLRPGGRGLAAGSGPLDTPGFQAGAETKSQTQDEEQSVGSKTSSDQELLQYHK